MQTILKITLFSSPQIVLNGEELTNQWTPKVSALFIYLVVTEHAHARDLLADLLWSELTNQQARNNLRYTLAALRRVVSDYLIITPRSIAFNRQAPYQLDVAGFRTKLATKTAALSTQELQATLDLYQREFLTGFSVRNAPVFETWILQQRQALHTLAMQALYTLAKRYYQQGDIQAGLASSRRLLHWEPWHEAGQRLQMQLLAADGQRSAALAQYALCRHILADELGVEPEAATTALYKQIQGGQADERAGRQGRNDAEETHHLVTASLDRVTPERYNPRADRRLLPNNLPSQLTPFIGRQQEIFELRNHLLHPDNRLVTLVGEGGIGKTRLALAVAQSILDFGGGGVPSETGAILDSEIYESVQNPKSRVPSGPQNPKFPDGIWFVALSTIMEADNLTDQLVVAVAKAMDLQFSGNQLLLTQLVTQVRDKALCLIFDNTEHLLPAVADFLLQILQGSPRITVLVTSRHLLNLQAESVWRVPGLLVSALEIEATLTPTSLMRYSSIALFAERASRNNRNFQVTPENGFVIAAICRLVEGLPLAIELAAALAKQYTCAELFATLQRDHTILATSLRDLAPRHRSIQAMLDYSWRFLRPDEAHALAACSIFVGGFTLGAATTITSAPPALFTQLVDQSLLQVHAGRFTMHELVRHYAAVQLAQWPVHKAHATATHAAYYIDLLYSLEGELVVNFAAQKTIQNEIENVRAAWHWSIDQRNLTLIEKGLESLHYFYRLTGIYHEAIRLLEMALTAVRQVVAASPTGIQLLPLLARLLCHIAEFYRRTDGVEMGERLGQEALEVGRRLVDPALQGLAYHRLARLAYTRSNFLTMRDLAEEGCRQARQAGAPHLIAECLNDLGIAVSACTGPLSALPHYYQALAVLQGAANRILEAYVLVNLGFFSLAACQYQAAYLYLQRGLALQHLLQDRGGRLPPLIHVGNLRMALGDYPGAQAEYEEALRLAQTIRGPYWESWLYTSYGRWQHLNGDQTAARTTYLYAQQIAQKGGIQLQEQWALVYLGHVLTALGEIEPACHAYQQAIALHKAGNWLYRTVDAYAGLAAILLYENKVTEAVVQVEAALEILTQHGLAAAAEPFTVYWTVARVFMAADDPRAADILRTAGQTLQEIASKLEDEALRRAFLENVAVNRDLMVAAQTAGLL